MSIYFRRVELSLWVDLHIELCLDLIIAHSPYQHLLSQLTYSCEFSNTETIPTLSLWKNTFIETSHYWLGIEDRRETVPCYQIHTFHTHIGEYQRGLKALEKTWSRSSRNTHPTLQLFQNLERFSFVEVVLLKCGCKCCNRQESSLFLASLNGRCRIAGANEPNSYIYQIIFGRWHLLGRQLLKRIQYHSQQPGNEGSSVFTSIAR